MRGNMLMGIIFVLVVLTMVAYTNFRFREKSCLSSNFTYIDNKQEVLFHTR